MAVSDCGEPEKWAARAGMVHSVQRMCCVKACCWAGVAVR